MFQHSVTLSHILIQRSFLEGEDIYSQIIGRIKKYFLQVASQVCVSNYEKAAPRQVPSREGQNAGGEEDAGVDTFPQVPLSPGGGNILGQFSHLGPGVQTEPAGSR